VRGERRQGIGELRAGVLAIVVIAVASYFGFTKTNPFANPYELKAVFDNVSNLQQRSPVRIAGVDVGKVTKVEPIADGEGAGRVTMEIADKGLPIHEDATLKIRGRIFLEGNFFIDVKAGSPSARVLDDGETIPVQQTAAPVQFGQILTTLQSDVRADLKTLLREFTEGLEGEGARGFNQAVRYWERAYRNTALVNDATLGLQPTRDLQRVLRGQQRTFAALVADEGALKDLVTNFNVTAGAFARQDAALEASVPALRDTLRAALPALDSVNDALPTLRAFAVEALPGVRSSVPTLDAAIPFIRQARLLVRRSELRGLAAELRARIPSLVRLNRVLVPILQESRSLSHCTNEVLVPFVRSRLPSVAESGGSEPGDIRDQQVRFQVQRGFVGLAGESRLSDGNNQFFHAMGVPNAPRVQPAPRSDVNQPPPRRPDVPCETQDPPNLEAPVASTTALGGSSFGPTSFDRRAVLRAAREWKAYERGLERLESLTKNGAPRP
jgi:phospholipid/cholesterol/gamma-HCH transport system substrate-binding protein